MGVYYKVVCDELREKINPSDVDAGGVKIGEISWRGCPYGSLVIYTMDSRWGGRTVRLVSDAGGDDEAYYEYTDVTKEVIDDYNSYSLDRQIRYGDYNAKHKQKDWQGFVEMWRDIGANVLFRWQMEGTPDEVAAKELFCDMQAASKAALVYLDWLHSGNRGPMSKGKP